MKTLWAVAAAFYLALTAVTMTVLQPADGAAAPASRTLFAKR